jgi:hypothetical protein
LFKLGRHVDIPKWLLLGRVSNGNAGPSSMFPVMTRATTVLPVSAVGRAGTTHPPTEGRQPICDGLSAFPWIKVKHF